MDTGSDRGERWTWYMGYEETLQESWKPWGFFHVWALGRMISLLVQGWTQGAVSHLLVVCSALSSFEDVLDEAVYEEIDYLVTTKEDLLGSTGVYSCFALLDPLVVSSPCCLWVKASQNLQTPYLPQAHRSSPSKGCRMGSCWAPVSSEPSLYTTGVTCALAFLFSITTAHGCERVCSVYFVTFFSTLGALSDDSVTKLPYYTGDGEDNSDFRSAPGSRGESALAGYWGHGTSLHRGWDSRGTVFLWLGLLLWLLWCASWWSWAGCAQNHPHSLATEKHCFQK